MTIDRQAEGTVSIATAGASDPITCTPAWPTHTTGDLGLLIVTTKHDTEATPTVTAGGGETWESVGSASGGGGSFGAGTGPIRITVFRCVATSSSMATPTVNLAGTNTGRNMQAVICTARKTGGDSYETAVAFVAEATAGTGWTQAHTSDPGITSGDLLYCIYGVRDDQAAAFSAMGFTATGATISSVTERVDSFTAEGNDQGLGVGTANCTAGTASANGTQTATIGSSESGEMAVLRVREFTTPAGPEIAAFESSWTATTDPKTVSATSCLTDDFVVVLSGGNQDSGSDITAVDTTTSAGSTGSWTDPVEEDVSGAAADDWISSAIAQVTGDGTVTPQVELTHSGANTPTPWGMWVARVRNSAGLGVHGKTATSSTQVVSLTVEQDSAVVFLSVDWDAGSVGTFTPAGATEVERAVETATYTVHAAYWLGQDAGTRNYGHSGGGGAKYRCVAIELLAETAGVSGTAAGVYTFTGTASGVRETFGTAAGTWAFTGTAAGAPRKQGTTNASIAFTGTATGNPRSVGQAAAVLVFTGTASGEVGAPPVTGTADGTYLFTGTAAGTPKVIATAAAALAFTGTASGHPTKQGTAAAAWAFTGTANGVDRAVGTADATLTFTGTAAGTPEVFGQAAGTFTFTGNANGFAGTPPVTGTAAGVYTFTGAAAGVDRSVGTAQAAFAFLGAVQGVPDVQGQASGAFTFTGTVLGVRDVAGIAVGEFIFIGAAESPPPITRGNVTARHRAAGGVTARNRAASNVTARHRDTSTVGG